MKPGRVVWLAVADARGHLMRAHLMKQLLAREDIEVDVLTTSDEGAAFIEAMGTPATVLSREHRVEFDDHQNLSHERTDTRVARYLADPRGCLRDLKWLQRRAAGADLVVNDSFHPALMLATRFARFRRLNLVQVYGENLRRALEHHFDGRGPASLRRWFVHGVRSALADSFARIEHTFGPPGFAGETPVDRLPTLIAAPARSRDVVRRSVGLAEDQKLAVVYLNPHFRDPGLAKVLETALARAGYAMHAVGEGFAGRQGWHAWDSALVDAIAASDVFVSAAGMAGLGQAMAFGIPYLALVTRQPEQEMNLSFLAASRIASRVVALEPDAVPLVDRLSDALMSLSTAAAARPDPAAAAKRIQEMWTQTFVGLLERSQHQRCMRAAHSRKEATSWLAA